eukprot:jgi/Chlat1/8394/Chrsp80S07831
MADRKAALRSLMKGAVQKRDNRIDHPLAKYNASGQLTCAVCQVVVKSEAIWSVHCGSKKHTEAVQALKARALQPAGAVNTASNPTPTKPAASAATKLPPPSAVAPKTAAAGLPADFFDAAPTAKKPRPGTYLHLVCSDPAAKPQPGVAANHHQDLPAKAVPSVQSVSQPVQPGAKVQGAAQKSGQPAAAEKEKPTNAALPEGFFDDTVADHKARGIELVKPDVVDQLQQFQQAIQGDLEHADDEDDAQLMEAAEVREERDAFEQMLQVEKIETLRKETEERRRRAAAAARHKQESQHQDEEDSEGEEIPEDVMFDWRVKRF